MVLIGEKDGSLKNQPGRIQPSIKPSSTSPLYKISSVTAETVICFLDAVSFSLSMICPPGTSPSSPAGQLRETPSAFSHDSSRHQKNRCFHVRADRDDSQSSC